MMQQIDYLAPTKLKLKLKQIEPNRTIPRANLSWFEDLLRIVGGNCLLN